jgi:hypothetical protein
MKKRPTTTKERATGTKSRISPVPLGQSCPFSGRVRPPLFPPLLREVRYRPPRQLAFPAKPLPPTI